MRSTARRTHALRGRATVVTVAGAAAALVGAGTASAATLSTATHTASAATSARAERLTGSQPVSARELVRGVAAPTAAPAQHVVLTSAIKADPKAVAPKTGTSQTGGVVRGSAKPAAPQAESWSQISEQVARQTSASEPKAADQLRPVGTAGPQAWMPMSKAQLANATTIVKQALAKKMGMRSAVIAVATSMQEAQLQNIDYGTSESVGLFQQQPDCGWGSAQQIMNPTYSADAFLGALHTYQAGNPGWAHQPLWQTAQGVQHSGFPFAYAKWETQAAQLVKQIVTNVK